MRYPNFRAAYSDIVMLFKREAKVVSGTTWQGVDVSNKPEMATHEMGDVFFQFPIATTNLDYHRSMIGPHLPWADDHFEKDRVSGEPLNPGLTWKQWPYALKADGFREYNNGPLRSAIDWAYLSGLIDGDGSFAENNRHDNGIIHPRIKITQLDRKYLTSIQKIFKVGTLREYSCPTNQLSDKGSLIWRISKREEVRWVLTNTIPHLRLKKKKAQELLKKLPDSDGRFNDEAAGRISELMFNHSYAERYWCAHPWSGQKPRGIRYAYGDLNDVIDLLVRNPGTRNAYLPVWFPEDTGVVHGGRTPCTIGYLFRMRENRLSVSYDIRSCDFVRHFKDDVYLTVRLLIWVIEQCRKKDERWNDVQPGMFTMHIGSFHIFENDWRGVIG